MYIKLLGWEERATWGACPICQAPQGDPCRPDAGIPLDVELGTGAHVARLINAPTQIVLIENDPQEIAYATTPSRDKTTLTSDAQDPGQRGTG